MQSWNFSPERNGWRVHDEVVTALREQHLAWEREQYDEEQKRRLGPEACWTLLKAHQAKVLADIELLTGVHQAARPARLRSNCRNCGAPPEPVLSVCSYCRTAPT
jgi:hypothetical protein